MNTDKDNKNLDKLITSAISRDNLKFDFNKWKQNHKIEIEIFNSQGKLANTTFNIDEPNIRKMTSWRRIGYIAAAFLIISSLAACFILYEKVTRLKDELEITRSNVKAAQANEKVTINFYLREHEDLIAHKASFNSVASQPAMMDVNESDIMYYEFIHDRTENMNPGIIVRGPSSQDQFNTSQKPAISNGHTLTLSEARELADFNLVSPSWLLPCYRLDQIRMIEGRDAIQILYTNGINSISLFEQSLDGKRRLSQHDFREYAVYNNTEQKGMTILAWRDNSLSYVLIGNTELSQLMDIAQSINAVK